METWNKIYIKKINEKNYIFSGTLLGDFLSIDYERDYEKRYQNVTSKSYLDEVLRKEANKKQIEKRDNFVELFNVVD